MIAMYGLAFFCTPFKLAQQSRADWESMRVHWLPELMLAGDAQPPQLSIPVGLFV